MPRAITKTDSPNMPYLSIRLKDLFIIFIEIIGTYLHIAHFSKSAQKNYIYYILPL